MSIYSLRSSPNPMKFHTNKKLGQNKFDMTSVKRMIFISPFSILTLSRECYDRLEGWVRRDEFSEVLSYCVLIPPERSRIKGRLPIYLEYGTTNSFR